MGKSGAIICDIITKRKLITYLRTRLIPQNDVQQILFSILIYILIKELPPSDVVLKIDEEYTGKEELIEETLEKLLHKRSRGKWKGSIRFGRIGKQSSAHKMA